MSNTTRTHRANPVSPRYTKARGIGRDRMRWPASLGTYRRGMAIARTETKYVDELSGAPTEEQFNQLVRGLAR